MSSYQHAIKEALNELGLKKVIAEVLVLRGVIGEKTSGQIIINTQSAGVTMISLNNWKIE